MGVGTLILFIALILVCVVASTVIITTTFKMQQQAEHTGDIARADVATGFKIYNIAASRDNPNDAWAGNTNMFEILIMNIGLMSGSGDINVSDLIIEITDGFIEKTLKYVDTAPGENFNTKASATEFTVQSLRDMAPVNDTIEFATMTPGDISVFYIDCNATGLRLTTQTTCKMKFIPKHGVPTYEFFMTPSVYGGRLVTPIV